MERKRTPRIPLTPEELDRADAMLTGRPTLAEEHGWTKELYAAVDAAIDEQRWEQPKDSDPTLIRINDRIDRNSKQATAQGKARLAARLRKIQRDHEYGAAFVQERAQHLWEFPKHDPFKPMLDKKRLRTTRKQNLAFYARDARYQRIGFGGHEYHLTPQAGAIVKVLHEAKGARVAKAEIQFKTNCGKISDSFRRLDGPQVWRRLIEVTKGRKGFYSLREY